MKVHQCIPSIVFSYCCPFFHPLTHVQRAFLEILDSKVLQYLSILNFNFGGARSKGFAMLRNVSKLQFFDKIGQAKSVGFRFYSAI